MRGLEKRTDSCSRVSTYHQDVVVDHRSLERTGNFLKPDLSPNFHPIFRRVSDINFPQAASFC